MLDHQLAWGTSGNMSERVDDDRKVITAKLPDYRTISSTIGIVLGGK